MKFKDPLRLRGQRSKISEVGRKNQSKHYALTYSDIVGKDGLIKSGMFVGCPDWVAFYIAEQVPAKVEWKSDHVLETYRVSAADRKAFKQLSSAAEVQIRSIRTDPKSFVFRFEVEKIIEAGKHDLAASEGDVVADAAPGTDEG